MTTDDTDKAMFIYNTEGQEAAFLNTRTVLCEWAVSNYGMGRFLCKLVMKGEETKFEDPEEPTGKTREQPPSDFEVKKYFRELDENRRKQEKLDADTAAFVMFTIRKCHETLKNELKSLRSPNKSLDDIITDNDLKGLFDNIQGLVHHTIEGKKKNVAWMRQRNWRRLMKMQQHSTDLDQHGRNFSAQCNAVEVLWGRLQPQSIVGDLNAAKQTIVAEQFKACLFMGSLHPRYQPAIDSLHSDFLKNNDHFPGSIEEAISCLKSSPLVAHNRSEHNFNQVDEEGERYEDEDEYFGESELLNNQTTEEAPEPISVFMRGSSSRSEHRSGSRSDPPHPNSKEAWNARAGFS